MSTFIRLIKGDYPIGTPWVEKLSGDYATGVDEPTAFAWNLAGQWFGSVQVVRTSGNTWLPLS